MDTTDKITRPPLFDTPPDVIQRPQFRGSLEERFWPKVKKSDGCWLWVAYTDPGKMCYGRLMGEDGKDIKAHRASWIIHHGPIPEGMLVCHHCDNPNCVRPDHLFLGTQTENVRDCMRKGRFSMGAHHPFAKLNPQQVVEIRQSTESERQLAKRYGVHHATIHQARCGTTWAHIPDVPADFPKRVRQMMAEELPEPVIRLTKGIVYWLVEVIGSDGRRIATSAFRTKANALAWAKRMFKGPYSLEIIPERGA